MSNASAVQLSLGAQEVLYLAIYDVEKTETKSRILHLIHMLYHKPCLLMALQAWCCFPDGYVAL